MVDISYSQHPPVRIYLPQGKRADSFVCCFLVSRGKEALEFQGHCLNFLLVGHCVLDGPGGCQLLACSNYPVYSLPIFPPSSFTFVLFVSFLLDLLKRSEGIEGLLESAHDTPAETEGESGVSRWRRNLDQAYKKTHTHTLQGKHLGLSLSRVTNDNK